ncbi:S8 family serine peptidase [Streptomyces sp. VRA16 Mangrove soil]|uniref:S8 family serine peptidase n=1 Tax=Streptomyces sp. VRA16 Mangrove soil TaxID=2817434 RepID=UPI001A9ECFE4|nr:S8 family serine peptidase [Streptomyces sp. VRA16 Mangrove soil]MBO1332708.1 S8 family serine peptidase [Streptomyces sp. VRA16 Mangrove soil]
MTRGTARRGAALVSAGLAFALLPAAGAHATPDNVRPQAAPSTKAARAAHTVTLVTGDKVTVTDIGGGQQTVDVKRPEGATGLVRTQVTDGEIRVVPDEAAPYLASGKLDARLFDVSELIRQGLADAKADATPLIVTYSGKSARTAAATPKGGERTRRLGSIAGAALHADKGRTFWNDLTTKGGFSAGIGKVWLDGRVEADMEQSNAQIGTPKAWEAGLTGKGVKVAVLDTGYDATHPDLASRVTESKSFIEGQEVADRAGHGTHVTSTVGGSGAASDGKEKGVAPDATLAVGKVLSNEGSGTESQIIAGMEWAAKDVKAKIISMSLGSSEGSDGTDPMARAVNSLSADTGALFVIAAGNAYGPGTIGSPGAADSALTVGAVDSSDRRAGFSSQGPRLGDDGLKPDVSAPGVDILAARSSLTEGSGSYTTMSGTSMATPHVAGVAALLAQAHPDWTGAQLKDALMSSSKQLSASAYAIGSGRVSVPDAIAAKVTATGSADLGSYRWPYESNQPVTQKITYSNSSDSAVELDLAVQGAADGVATLADPRLTVPAHGSASTTVTGDGAKAVVGTNSGQIVASSGGTAVAHTAFGLVKEDERYTLTVHVKDRDGNPTAANLMYQQLVKGAQPQPATVDDSGTLKLRLKPGTYFLDSFLDVRGAHGKDSLGKAFLSDPEVKVDGDREITLDGTKLREVATRVAKDTDPHQTIVQYDRKAGGADVFGMVLLPIKYDTLYALPTRPVSDGSYAYRTTWRKAQPRITVDGVDEVWEQPGSTLLTGRSTLALVNAGAGAPADYAGKNASGKGVLVHADGTLTPAQIAQAAQDAGAKALFLTDDAPGRLNTLFYNDDHTDRPLQIASVTHADFARLIAKQKRGERIAMNGVENATYSYDLSKGYQGVIPDRSLLFAPNADDLATVDTTFYGRKKTTGDEFRYSVDPSFAVAGGFQEQYAFPGHRTDYVSVEPGQTWHESVNVGSLEERSGRVAYRAGKRTELNWFKPVWHPYGGSGLGWGQQRRGDALRFNIPGWGDSGPDHTGFGNPYSSESGMEQYTEAFVDGQSAGRRVGSTAQFSVSDGAELPFKIVTDTALDPAVWGTDSTSHSEWTFRSGTTPTDSYTFLPLINLNYDLDTDLAGAVKAGSRLPVGLSAEYVKGAAGTGTLGGGTLEVSYDGGKTWKSVSLTGTGTSWTGTLSVPRDAASVSLRATAKDDKGGSISQEIIRAAAVK